MKTFALQMEQFAKVTQRDIGKVIEDSTIAVGSAIIDDTPVGDPSLWKNPPPPGYKPGTLRNSWFATLDQPYGGSVRKQGVAGRASFLDLIEVAKQSKGRILYFINPAPYARRVEFGWSHIQRPEGMVRLNVQAFPDMVTRAVGNLK